jgi:uncharacterized protein with FMN-binding domain
MATMGVLATGIAWGSGVVNASTDESAQDTTDNTSASTESTTTESTDSDTSATESDSTSSESTATDGTYVGDVVQTRYGPMQVEVVITNGSIESATALQQPGDDRESQQINARVIPILNDAIVQYQTVNFGNVSRATISTDSYKQSAQSALDQAGFTG